MAGKMGGYSYSKEKAAPGYSKSRLGGDSAVPSKVYKIMKSLSQTQYNLLLFVVVALWGSLYVGNRVILGYMPVLWLLFFRFAISAAVLIPITIQRGLLQPQRADWPRFLLVGGVGYFASNALLTLCTPLTVTAYGMAVAAVFSLPTAFVESAVEGAGVVWALEPALWMAFVALVCTAFSHMMWNFCLAHQEAGHCAAFYPVQPMVSMLLGVVLLGEKITPSFLLGSALIIFSVVLNSLPARIKEKNV